MSFFSKRAQMTLLILCAFAAGFANGLLGTGGGIIIVFILNRIAKKSRKQSQLSDPTPTKSDGRDIFASALAVMFPLSLISLAVYGLRGVFGKTPPETLAAYILPAALGGYIGAWLLYKIKLPFLQKLFALLVIWSGLYMIIT